MFDKIADIYIDVYDGPTDKYLGSINFLLNFQNEKIFLDMINYHIIPKSITLADVNLYQASSDYKPPEPYEEKKRRGVVHAKVRDSASKTWMDVEIYFTFNVRTRGNVLEDQYHFDSVTYTNLDVQEIRLRSRV
ncbi:MAG: hypothetical protein AB7E30_10110 [Lawsonibacter sp.]